MSNAPVSGKQALEVSNLTGDANCDSAIYTVCGAGINITDWTLTVLYTDSTPGTHIATFGPNAGDPIAPISGPLFLPFGGAPGLPWIFDESCPGSCPPFVTEITLVTLTGSLSSTDLTLFDGSTFFAAPTFTVNYAPTVSFDTGNNFVFYNPAEILVNDAVPEPSGLSLVVVGACVFGVSRLIRRRNLHGCGAVFLP
jgi:hypothetical protein